MATVLSYPHILIEEGKPARLERTPRVRVAQLVVDYLNYGWSPEEMCRQHPCLSLPEAYAAMAFYFDHQAEIDAEIEAEAKQIEETMSHAAPSPLVRRLRVKGLLLGRWKLAAVG